MSVVVPARDAASTLQQSLSALVASDLARDHWELIVVDDASADGTAAVAAGFANTLVRLPGASRGPAYARNRGVEVARGEYVVFISADVCVAPDTLRRLHEAIADAPDTAAVSGGTRIAETGGLLARFRTAQDRFRGERASGPTAAVVPDLSIVRRAAFVEAGMWDEWCIDRPRNEATDLGMRLRGLGYEVLLTPDIDAASIRRWSPRDALRSDVRDHGMSWPQGGAPLLWSENARARSGDTAELVASLVLVAGLGVALASLFLGEALQVTAGLLLAFAVVMHLPFIGFCATRVGFGFAIVAIPLHMSSCLISSLSRTLDWTRHHLFGEPRPDPVIEAFAEVGVKVWPPIPRRRQPSKRRSPALTR